MKQISVVIVCTVVLQGCFLGDAILGDAKTELLKRHEQAYTMGEARGFVIAFSGTYDDDTLRELRVLLDEEIRGVANTDKPYTTGRVRFVLLALGLADSDAQAALGEVNVLISESPLLLSDPAGLEKRGIVQNYFLGMYDGIKLAQRRADEREGLR